MRSPRWILAVTTLCAVTALSSCSGSDSDDAKGSGDTASSAPEKQADCQAKVKLSGAAKGSWSGDAFVITGGDNQAFYKTTKGEKSVSIIPGRDDQPATPIVTVKGATFTVQPDSDGVEVDADGAGAKVDADATGTKKGKPVTVHVTAEFAC
jgi:hypothetical protein